MATLDTNLNLARKWRPKSFDTVVGQDTAIRMLKNSLFLNKFFPVYLFAGQRGCGKTSTARIFAAAINCEQLSAFQTSPAGISIPCLTCPSCVAMIHADHPDFIEIDAASHTGVDNVRQIIESSSYMPLIGRKKIYLIDEAHMLSKAAFNAFLKILEEPPLSVVFILATTETPKIPSTVLSRCFQLIFNPIATASLKTHLQEICTNEQVSIEDGALDILLDETEGSARDAINLLERVRFSSDVITEQTILNVLGKISNKELFTLFDFLIEQHPDKLLVHLQTINFEQRSPQLLWDMMIQICRHLVWIKYGVLTLDSGMKRNLDELKGLAQKCSLNRLIAMLNFFWAQEELFLKTNKKHLFLEITLLQLCQQVNASDLDELIKACSSGSLGANNAPAPKLRASEPIPIQPAAPVSRSVSTSAIATTTAPKEPIGAMQQDARQPQPPPSTPQNSDWAKFLVAINQVGDQLLESILTQANFIKKDTDAKKVVLQLSADSTFFKNKIDETKPAWLPFLIEIFPDCNDFSYIPAAPQARRMPPPATPIARPAAPIQRQNSTTHAPAARESDFLSIKNPDEWPLSSLILRFFSGKIKKIKTNPDTF